MWQVTENCTPATGLMRLGVYLIANNLAISPIFAILVVILLFDYDTIKKQCYRSIIFLHWVANYRGVIVSSNLKKKVCR
ncbi:MAG: hypothetical protein CM15mP2_1160 [Methanobacteriota archaeon]|nr:MAG: hypothetical protein CM15mP2_1160 [Euryarchaeota archaeon]